ncbi:DUF5343 domain-containing protein [Mucilaginibacter aquaedulcis]|uniref:DUF5343 domain-containing protein n=1 Tax=Mucilaginibacter aquaedulcis TaxID=1187081 RepID=UPI0025B4BB42|nr:DUF5343 domain-containing protein [Mucilaginibacter aquaedulcis]MDN3547453.1 DUF5343 domain-containing protein [Mucilaginibacter aquaedulcis]
MLSKKYLNSVKNLPAIMKKIIEGTAPDKFTTEHLKKIGFASSTDRAVLGLLKDLGFISDSGSPTQRYHDYRNTSKSNKILGEALKDAYTEIFHINEKPSQSDRPAITGLFKSTHNVSDQVAGFMANTFLTLLSLADITGTSKLSPKKDNDKTKTEDNHSHTGIETLSPMNNNGLNVISSIVPNLRYNIEIHLPSTKDIEVYNAIFKSLREHLLNE